MQDALTSQNVHATPETTREESIGRAELRHGPKGKKGVQFHSRNANSGGFCPLEIKREGLEKEAGNDVDMLLFFNLVPWW